MRHKKTTKTIDRKTGPRRALLRTLTIALIENGRITTTPTKAKAVERFVEPLITRAGAKNLQSIRVLESRLANKQAALKLVNEIGPRFKERPGGYTRMVKVAPRLGDGAKQVVLEFVND